jgi:hypothetical protein
VLIVIYAVNQMSSTEGCTPVVSKDNPVSSSVSVAKVTLWCVCDATTELPLKQRAQINDPVHELASAYAKKLIPIAASRKRHAKQFSPEL